MALGVSAGGHLASFLATNDVSRLVPPPPIPSHKLARPSHLIAVSSVQLLRLRTLPGEVKSRLTLLGRDPTPTEMRLVNNTLPEWTNSTRSPSTLLFHCLRDPVVGALNSLVFHRSLLASHNTRKQQRRKRDKPHLVLLNCTTHGMNAFTSNWAGLVLASPQCKVL